MPPSRFARSHSGHGPQTRCGFPATTTSEGDSLYRPFGNVMPGAGPNTLFFTAGINHEADGLFGEITPNP